MTDNSYGDQNSPVKAITAAGAGAVLDALGRWWKPWLHPRDRFGQFIHTLSRIKVSLARGGSGDDMTAEIRFVDPETSSVYAKIMRVLSPDAKNKGFVPGDMVVLPKENFEVLPAKARIEGGDRKGAVKISRNDTKKIDKLIDDLQTNSKNRPNVDSRVRQAASIFAAAFEKYFDETRSMPDGGSVLDERYVKATADFSESIDQLLNTLDEVRGEGRSPGDRRTPGQDDAYGTMIDDKINTLMTVQRLVEGGERTKGRFTRVGKAQADAGTGDEQIPAELKALIESSARGAGPQFKDINGNLIDNPILEAVKTQARIDAQAGKTTLTPEEYALKYVAGGGLATTPELSGVTQLAPVSTRGTEVVAARRSLDTDGNPVSTGDFVVVEAGTKNSKRPALNGIVLGFGKSKGKDFIKVRAFSTPEQIEAGSPESKDWRIFDTSNLRVTTPEGASQASIMAGVPEEGVDYSESQKAIIDLISESGGRRFTGQGAGRTSETSRGGASVLDRKKKDANGRLIGVGDWVRDLSTGLVGRIEYLEEASNTIRVAFQGASFEKARKVSSNFELVSGANGWDYNRGDVDNVAGTGVLAVTREEAAKLARSYDLTNAADAIERGGDKAEIQAALAEDEQWTYIAPELARAKAELIDQARRGIATGPANDYQATLLQDGSILGAAFEGQFADGQLPEPEAPRIITPTPPKDAPESAIPAQVYKDVPDGSIVIANPEDKDSIFVVTPDKKASEYRRDTETGDFVDMGPMGSAPPKAKKGGPTPAQRRAESLLGEPIQAEVYAARDKAARDSISELLGIDATGLTREEIANTPEMKELIDKISKGDQTIIDKVNRVGADFREISMAEKVKENGPLTETSASTPATAPAPSPEAPAKEPKPAKPTNIDTNVAEKFVMKLESDIFDLAENGTITPNVTQTALNRLLDLDDAVRTGKEDVFNEAARSLARTPGLPAAMSNAIDDFIDRNIESGGIFKGTRAAEAPAPEPTPAPEPSVPPADYTPASNVPDGLKGYVKGLNTIMDNLGDWNAKWVDSIMDTASRNKAIGDVRRSRKVLLDAYSNMQEVFNNPDATNQQKDEAVINVFSAVAEALPPTKSILATQVRNAAARIKSKYNIDEKAAEIVGPDAAAEARDVPLSETVREEPSTNIVGTDGELISTGFVAELKETRLPVPEDGLTAEEVDEYFDNAVLAYLNEVDGASLIIRTDEDGNTVISVGVATPDEATAADIAAANDDVYYDAVAGEWKAGADFTAPEEPTPVPEEISYTSDLSGLNLEDVDPAFESVNEDLKSAWEDLKSGGDVSDQALQDIVDILSTERSEWVDAANDPITGEGAQDVVDVIDTALERISSRTGVSTPKEAAKPSAPEVVDTTPPVDETPTPDVTDEDEPEVVTPAEPTVSDLTGPEDVTTDEPAVDEPSIESYTDRADWYDILDTIDVPGDAGDRFMLGDAITDEERQALIDAVETQSEEIRAAIENSEYDTRQEEEDAKDIIRSATELVSTLTSVLRPDDSAVPDEEVVTTPEPTPAPTPEVAPVDEPVSSVSEERRAQIQERLGLVKRAITQSTLDYARAGVYDPESQDPPIPSEVKKIQDEAMARQQELRAEESALRDELAGGPAVVSVPDEPPAPDLADEATPVSAEPDDVPNNTEIVEAGPDPYADETFPPTEQQKAVVDAVLSGEDTVVRALAGTGKTSTLKLIAKRLLKEQPGKKIVYIAFNKSVQTEAEASMPSNVESRTADSIAWRAIGTKITGKSRNKEALRLPTLIAEEFGIKRIQDPMDPTESLSAVDVTRAIQRAINQFAISDDDTIGPQNFEFGADTPPELVDIANAMWADLISPEGKLAINNAQVTKMWALSNPDLSKDGSGLNSPADIIFFDEAQDINPVLAKVVADQGIQKVYVGDENQAIYGFRGAENQLENVSAPNDLPLTKSWRFGPEIAGIGNRFLTLLGAKTRVEGGGPSGTIVEQDSMQNADAVLVRTNGGGLAAIQEELEKGRTVGVSKAYKDELTSLVDTAEWLQGDRQGQRPSKVHEDLLQFKSWEEVLKEVADGSNRKVEMLANLIDSYGVSGLRDLLSNVKVAKTKDESGAAGEITPDSLVDGASGSLSNGVNYVVSGESGSPKITLSGKTFPIREEIKSRGYRFSSDTKSWSKSYDSPNAAAADLNSLQGTSSGEPVDVVITTAHKAKGLEWDNVRIGNDFWGPRTNPQTGKLDLPSPEELRLDYVAVTRAQKSLDPGALAWIFNQTDISDEAPNAPEQPATSAPSGLQVSDAQVQKFVNDLIDPANGGSSVDLTTGQDSFDEGYIVSLEGFEQRIPGAEFAANPQQYLDEYVALNSEKLSEKGKLLGVWFVPLVGLRPPYLLEEGQVVIDVSEVIADKDEAIQAGIDRNQDAIYDAANKTEIETKPKFAGPPPAGLVKMRQDNAEANAVNAGVESKQQSVFDAETGLEIFIGSGDGADYAPYTTADGVQVGITKNGEEFIPAAYPNLGSAGEKGKNIARRIDWGGQTFSTLVEALAFAEKQNANSETPAAKPSSSAKKKKKAVATNAQLDALTDWPASSLSRDRRKAVVDALKGTTPFTADSLDDTFTWLSEATSQLADRIESNDSGEDIAELKRQLQALGRLEAKLEDITPDDDGPGPSDGGGGSGPKAPSEPPTPLVPGGEISPMEVDLDELRSVGTGGETLAGKNERATATSMTIEDAFKVIISTGTDEKLKERADIVAKYYAENYADELSATNNEIETAVLDKINNGTDSEILSRILSLFDNIVTTIKVNNVTLIDISRDTSEWYYTDGVTGSLPGEVYSGLEDTLTSLTENFPIKGPVQVTIGDNLIRDIVRYRGERGSIMGFANIGQNFIALSRIAASFNTMLPMVRGAKQDIGTNYTLVHEWGHLLDRRNEEATDEDFIEVKRLIDDEGATFTSYGLTNGREAYAEAFLIWFSGDTSNPIASYFANMYGWPMPKNLTSGPVVSAATPSDRLITDGNFPVIYDTFLLDPPPTVSYEDPTESLILDLSEETNAGEEDGKDDTAQAPGGGERGRFSNESDQGASSGGSSDERGPSNAGSRRLGNRRIIL